MIGNGLVLCRFLDEYDLKVSNGPFKYKKAAEFLMNTTIIGIKGIVKNVLAAKESAAQRAAAAEATVAQVRVLGKTAWACGANQNGELSNLDLS